ncbi:MAG: hypothetical protein ACD_75C00188G0001, partial [uncultured bacterium]
MPAPMARDKKVLSTPKKTSARGWSLARMAWTRAAPASPDFNKRSLTPFSRSKAATSSVLMLKLSWVIRVS